jgi:hypothetical protein
MVGAAYVGGCTVTFMALQVRFDDAIDNYDADDGSISHLLQIIIFAGNLAFGLPTLHYCRHGPLLLASTHAEIRRPCCFC